MKHHVLHAATLLVLCMLGAPPKGNSQTQSLGTVIGNQTVVSIPVYPPGYATTQALVYYPDDYFKSENASKRYPLFVFLHGANQSHSQDITELTQTSLPNLIANGLKPYAIDTLTGDTIKFIVVSPHCPECYGSYSYPQLQYTLPYLLSNYRVDTSCVFVGGIANGGGSSWSVAMGNNTSWPPTPDTSLAKIITGIMPIASGGYDDAITKTALSDALDTNLRRGLAVMYVLGDQDAAYTSPLSYPLYAHADTSFGVPGRWFHRIVAGAANDSSVWVMPFPLSARVWSSTQNAWTQMWHLRKNAPVTAPAYPPTANAGGNLTVPAGGTSAYLYGGASTAAYGHTLSTYRWSQVSGPTTSSIGTPDSVGTYVTGLSVGTYVFSLVVTDNAGLKDTATANVVVSPRVDTALVVRKAACSEYKTAWLYSDSVVRSFAWNNSTGHVELMPYVMGGRKAVDASIGFNTITVLDDQGYVWMPDQGTGGGLRWDSTAAGAAFNNNKSIYGYFTTYLSIRNDGTIWYWGDDNYHLFSPGWSMPPKQLHSPAGAQFVKLATGTSILGLTSTGLVYMWDYGDSNYKQVVLPRKATDIAASHQGFFVAVVANDSSSTMGYPYAWGAESRYYGTTTAAAYTAPLACKSLWGMSYPIKEISANQNAIHYIDSLGDLYGMGDNAQGDIGNGEELVNHAELYSTPYAWDWGKNEMMTSAPIHIAVGTKFKKLFTSNTYTFYHYALDVNDSLYFWGRNKSFAGGDGAVSYDEGTYPNAMDILKPSIRTPIAITGTMTTSYSFTLNKVNATAQQNISDTAATLAATATPATLTAYGKANYGYTLVKYLWTKISGPAGAVITHPDSLTTRVTGLVNGTYIFNIQTTDNNTATISARDTIVVSGVGGAAFAGSASSRTGNTLDQGGPRTVNLYPNPVSATGELTIGVANWREGRAQFLIHDMAGRLMKTVVVENPAKDYVQRIGVGGLARGSYLLTVVSEKGGKPEVLKFVIQ